MNFLVKLIIFSMTYVFITNTAFANNFISVFEAIDQNGGLGNFSNEKLIKLSKQLDQHLKTKTSESDEFSYLSARSNHLKSFIFLKDKLDKCEQEKSKRNLSKRVLDESSKFENIKNDCEIYERQFSELEKFSDEIIHISKNITDANYYKEIQNQSLQNIAKTFANIQYSYSPEKELSPDDLYKEFCTKKSFMIKKSICNESSKSLLLNTLKSELKLLKDRKTKRYTHKSTSRDINDKVSKLNEKVKKINKNIKTIERSFWFDKAEFNDQFDNEYQKYVDSYLSYANHGPGILMMTDHLKDKIGTIKTKDDVDNDNDKFKLRLHNKISTKDISKALIEVTDSLKESIKTTNEKYSDNSLRDIVMVNPRAVAQTLIKSPQYAQKTCNIINQINLDDKRNEKIDKAMTWGGTIVGVGLLATGVGSLAGASILAGTAAGATAITIGTYTTAAGFALGLGEATYWGKRGIENYHEMKDLQESFIAQTGDKNNIHDNRRALDAFKEARFDAALAFGFSSLDAGAALKLFKIGERTGVSTGISRMKEAASKSKKLSDFNDLLSTIANDSKLSKIFSEIKKVLGDKFSPLLHNISKLSSTARISFLKGLSKLPLESFRNSETLELALADATNQLIKKGLLKDNDLEKFVYDLNNDLNINFEVNYNAKLDQNFVTKSNNNKTTNLAPKEELDSIKLTGEEHFNLISSPIYSGYFKDIKGAESVLLAKVIKGYQKQGLRPTEIKKSLDESTKSCGKSG